MTDRQEDTELNRWPVSVAARLMLLEAGAVPDPKNPYIFQLVLWALETGQAETEPDVLDTFKAMPEWKPQRIMNFLMLREDHEQYEPPGWHEAKDPRTLACLIIADMEAKMMVHFPWYGSVQ